VSQAEAATRNSRIRSLNSRSGFLYGLGATAVLGGTLLLLWPQAEALPMADLSPSGATLGIAGAF
jgi:hypothetical protein